MVMPATELDRANRIFERIVRTPEPEQQSRDSGRETEQKGQEPKPNREQTEPSKKGTRWARDSPDTRTSSATSRDAGTSRTTNERSSIGLRLQNFQEQIEKKAKSAPARTKGKTQDLTK